MSVEHYTDKRCPNLFLIGVPKAGTSAVADALSQHPDIFLSKLKEPRYFDAKVFFDYKQDYPFKCYKEYLKLFAGERAEKAEYRLDASVFSIYSIAALLEILEKSPNARFIIVLRDPVDAVLSMFNQRLKQIDPRLREVSDNFDDCWELVRARKKGGGLPRGCRNSFLFQYDELYSYDKFLPDVLSILQSHKVKVCFYEDFKLDAKNFMSKLFFFLDLPEPAALQLKVINPSYRVRPKYLTVKLSSVFFKIIQKSHFIRQRVGLVNTGLMAVFLRLFFVKDLSDRSDISKEVQVELQNFFSSTRQYVKDLKKRSKE